MNITKMNYNDIQNKIEEHLSIRTEEKNKYGEVFTPITLINEMLDKLDSNVWSNPNLKWLDPANGIGNFPMVVYHRLNKGLSNVILDEQERKSHIIKNMLYMIELNENNVKISQKIFGQEANIYCGSFLEDGWKDYFAINKFDVIVGNPPYNKDGVNIGGAFWAEFIYASFDNLNQNGFLCFVHPSAWRKPQDDKTKTKGLYNLMTKQNHLLYLEIHDTKAGKKTFNVGTRYDWYVLQKTYSDKPTIVKDQLGIEHTIQLKDWIFLPNHSYNIIKPLLGVSDVVIYSGNQYEIRKKWVQDTKTDEFKFPLIHSTNKKGVRYKWTNTLDPPVKKKVDMFGVPKVIFGETGINDVIIDMEGKYGLTHNSIGIKIDSIEEGVKLKKTLESEKFKKVLNACSWSNFQIDWRLFNHLIIKPLLGVSENVIYSRNQYETRKKWVQDNKTDEFKFPLIHSTPKKGVRYKWTNTLDPPVKKKVDMFGVPKVIFGETGINNVIIDMEGEYGLTNGSIGIKIDSIEEGLKLKKTLESEMFKKVLNACSWGNYRIDWRLFNHLFF